MTFEIAFRGPLTTVDQYYCSPEENVNKKQAEQSLNIFDLIDQLCGEFRQQWKAALQPQIESFLSQVPTEAQVTLFRNLLTLDVRLRQAAKQAPKSHEYKQRFPQFAKVIRETFLEPTLTSDRDAQDTSEGHSLEATVTVEPPAAHRIGDYELIRELGRGGFGVVYEARHLKRCDRVALKTLQTGLDGQQQIAERLHHFRREFRSLTELNHPNLIGMQTLEVDGKQWFLTMDLVEPAVDFVEYVRPGGDLDESRLRRCLEQLLRGITALHERGILHRDLKPSNVLVDGDGNLVILDFGLVTQKEAHVDQTVTAYANRFAGTPKYAAPEQFRGNFSAASDLYAVGTMLFIALSGKSPFEGDFAHLFCVKQEQDAAGLAVQDGLPTDLAELTDRLLKREPEERPDLASIQHALGLADESARSISRGLSGSSDRSEVLVGRSHQLAQLEQAYRTLLEERRSQAVFVSGRSGEGKSSLVAKFLEPLRLNDKVVVLSGRCYDRESVPFKALDGVIDALSRHMRSRSFEELADWLPRDTTLLAQLFPALRRVEAIASLPTPPTDLEPDRIRHRGFYALRELMRSASTKTPWVLFIDDLQWGDADSAQALFELLTCEPPVAILLVGCYRKDEAEKSEFLQTWQELEPSDHPSFVRIEVGPLTAEECLEVAAIRLGRPPQELSAWSSKLLKDTGGNPYFLDQLLEGFDVEGGEISAIPLGEIIDHRLGRLPTQAESLLQTIAVSGQALAADEAAQATGFAPSALPVLTRMRSEKLVRLIGREGASIVDTYHDKIRETVLAGLAENDRRRIHRQLAETIEAQDDSRAETLLANYRRRNADFEATSQAPPRVFDLAYHFQEAADPRACIYQVLAGEQALKAFAPKEALEHLSIAQQRLPPDVSAELRFALEFHLAEAFRQENRIGEATSQFQHALEFASDEDDRAEALIGLGDVFERQSNYPQATGCYDQALSAIGWKRPQSVPGKLLLAVRSFVRVVPAWETQRRTIDPSNCFRSRLAHDVYHRMNVYMQDHQPNDFVLLALHSALTAWHVGDRTHRAAANIHAAFFLTLIGLGWLGRRLQARADTAMEDGQALQLQALSTMKNAGVLYLNGQHREAASAFRSAAEFAERCGDYTSRNMALMTRGLSERWFVATCEEIDLSNQLLDSISNHEDPRTAAFGHHTQASALARRGELSEALLHAERAKQAVEGKTIVCETIVLYGMAGFVHLQGSNYKQAYEELSHAWDMACRFRAFFPFNVYSLSWILEAEAGPNWASKDASPTRRTSTRRQLAARALARVLPGNRPQLWRALGRQRAIQGRHRASIRYFQAALRLARKQDLTFEVAKILLDLAAVKEEGRQGNRTEAVRLLKQSESVIPRAEAWLLGEQYDEDAVTPEFDLEAWERLYGPMLRATKN